MIKKIYLLPLLLLSAFIFTSCNETEEPGKYDNWRARNEAFIDSLQQVVDAKSDPNLIRLEYSRDKKYAIYYKRLEKSPLSPAPVNTKAPYYTSTVKMAYRGMYINEAVFATAKPPYHYTELYEHLDMFDSRMSGAYFDPKFDAPVEFPVNEVVAGWTEILQRMKPGERFEVYIPYQLAYGEAGKGSVMGYSALIFDMEMLDVAEY